MKRYSTSARRRASHGFSIVEMLVAVVIGLVVSLAAFGMLSNSEGRKRTAVSVNDANQSGAYAAYTLDRVLRSAGSGYAQAWTRVGGCRLNATLPAGRSWPRTAALPAPFAAVPQTMRLAPVVIFQGASAAGSDVIAVMSGSAGFGEAPALVNAGSVSDASPFQVRLPNTIGFRGNDLVLLAANGECLLEQVDNTPAFVGGATQPLPLDGTYHTGTGTNTSLTALKAIPEVHAFSIGNAEGNTPIFQLFGVGADNTLFSHDMLLLNGSDTSLPVAEGVVELRAVYGVDTNADGVLDNWVDPAAATAWGGATLMDGTAASNTNLGSIVALRVGLVMRSNLAERDDVAPETLNLFADLPAAVRKQRTLSADEQKFRHRTVEITVPIRNLLLRI